MNTNSCITRRSCLTLPDAAHDNQTAKHDGAKGADVASNTVVLSVHDQVVSTCCTTYVTPFLQSVSIVCRTGKSCHSSSVRSANEEVGRICRTCANKRPVSDEHQVLHAHSCGFPGTHDFKKVRKLNTVCDHARALISTILTDGKCNGGKLMRFRCTRNRRNCCTSRGKS